MPAEAKVTIPTKPSHPNDIRINHARNFLDCMKTRPPNWPTKP